MLEILFSIILTSLFWVGVVKTNATLKISELEFKNRILTSDYNSLLKEYNLLKTLINTSTRQSSEQVISPLEKAYQFLGLNAQASLQEVKNKYRILIKKYHPDLNKSADALSKFKKIQAAYRLISNQ